ncbi:fatty acid synthase alpha subunit Lsd1 [Massospora cicadina]|nr:fatty acid synthase alpha subunit Lsd1 [Massospora cicadina]
MLHSEYESYHYKVVERQAKAYLYIHNSITKTDLVCIKHKTLYTPKLESSIYLNPQTTTYSPRTKIGEDSVRILHELVKALSREKVDTFI